MAEHPKKAEAFLDLAAGASLDDIARDYKVPKSTVQRWAKKVEEKLGAKPAEIRENKFDEMVQKCAAKAMEMLYSQMDLAEDRTWQLNMTAKPGGTQDVSQFSGTLLKQFTFIVSFSQGVAPDPASLTPGSRTIEAEIVDA